MERKKIDKFTRYWIEHSEYDFETAKAMLKTGRYLYVAFMCQQSVEKLIKAIITLKINIVPPRIHDLSKLSFIAKLNKELSKEQDEFLAELTPFCVIARYAGYKKKLSELTNARMAKSILEKTGRALKWLKDTKIYEK